LSAVAKRAASAAPARDGRQKLLARVHIARKEMGLDEDAYRDVLRRLTGRESAADISDMQIVLVLGEFRKLGWKPKSGMRPSAIPQVRIIYAIWKDVAALLDGEAGPAQLRAFVQRQTQDELHPDGMDAPEFCNPAQANKVIEGLKGWRANLRKSAKTKQGGKDAV
jgi:hypothetical protein